ncbi:hypothetical protein MMC30_002170 [Trapelia coarctata]|nr:hypothetical protein [Trapelia coarctata]
MRVLPPASPGSDIPSVAEIKQAITADPRYFFFYAGSGDGTINADWVLHFIHEGHREYSAKGYKMLNECFTPIDYRVRWVAQGGPTATTFWTAARVAFAEKAEGTVYVLLPPNVAVNSIWHLEKSILMASPTVQNIVEVDIYNNKKALKGSIPYESPEDEVAWRFQSLDISSER